MSPIETLFTLSGRVALVTGGSRGLGKAIARGLAEAGADVVIAGRQMADLRQAAIEVGQGLDRRIEWITADLADPAASQQLADQASERLGRVDVLVNNAGSNTPQPVDAIRDETWTELVELNLSSCMRLTRAVAPGMRRRRWGRVLHISSVLGLGAKQAMAAYCATKAGLIGLARASALDLGGDNITVNVVAPGPIETGSRDRFVTDAYRSELAARTALGRWGRPEDLVGAVLLLASDAGSFITGSVLIVDGGISCRVL